jgi:ribonuclease HI
MDLSDDESEGPRRWNPEGDRTTASIAEDDLLVFDPDKQILNLRNNSYQGPLNTNIHTMVVYIDGSCRDNGKPNATAAFGAYFGPQSKYNSAGRLAAHLPQTSTRAEIEALIQAVSTINEICSNDFSFTEIKIATDSSFLVNAMTKWMDGWIANNGIGSNKQPVKHFKTLKSLHDRLHEMRYGDDGGIECDFWLIPREKNQQADKLAREALQNSSTAPMATRLHTSIPSTARDDSKSGPEAVDLPQQLGAPKQTEARSTVFVLNMDKGETYEGFFDAIYADLIASLTSRYRVQRVRKPDSALKYLNNAENRPVAILIVDPAVVKKANVAVLERVKTYVRAGGTAVFMANFSSFITATTMKMLWSTHWGLDWQSGDYHRTDVSTNR